MRRFIPQFIVGALAAPMLLLASPASAAPDRAACGNIELLATGECHLEVSGGCKAQCEPISFVAACDGKCNIDISASCNVECSGSCIADCEVDPGSFDCRASCEVDCNANAEGFCEAEADKATCKGFVKASCESDCSAQCNVVPPQADCKAQCQGCCSGSCETEANIDCSLDCSAELKGGCEVDCDAPEGALFCDGQYVQVGNLEDCIAWLEAEFSLDIKFEASGSCDGSGCEGEASVGCSASPTKSAPLDVGAIAAMAVGLGMVAARRRRRS